MWLHAAYIYVYALPYVSRTILLINMYFNKNYAGLYANKLCSLYKCLKISSRTWYPTLRVIKLPDYGDFRLKSIRTLILVFLWSEL